MKLTERDLTALRWSVTCNERGVGYLGPTVKRLGPLPELVSLTADGLLRCEEDVRASGRRDADKCGYWITPAGRAALHPIEDTRQALSKTEGSSS